MRSCLILSIVRAFCWYGASSGLATTPSSPAPSNSRRTTARPRRVGGRAGQVARAGPARPAPPRARRGARRTAGRRTTRRRAPAGRRRRSRPASSRPACRPATSAGWIRSWSTSNSSRSPLEPATKSSPSSTQRSGSCSRIGRDHLGEVAGQRLGVAAGQLDLVAVLEHDAAEAVPLGLEATARRLGRVGDRP